jgi:hypothetical protein
MMKVLVLALAAATLAATHAEADAVWEGQFMVKGTAGVCESDPVGGNAYARLRIPDVAGNGPDTELALFNPSYAEYFVLPERLPDASFRLVEQGDIYTRAFQNDQPVSLRFTNIDPEPLTGATNFVNIVGQVRGWRGGPDCVATFNLALTKQPNL